VILFVVVGGGIDTVSVFLNALSVAEGWSRKTLSAGISVGVISAGLFTPVVGVLVDRFGVRVPMALGAALLALGFGVLAGMTRPWQFVAANVLLGPGFASAAMLPITVAVIPCLLECPVGGRRRLGPQPRIPGGRDCPRAGVPHSSRFS
jgi:MFS family permease